DEGPRLAQPLRVDEAVVGLPELHLGALAVVDVGEQAIPSDDLAVRVAKRKPTDLKPTVDAIKAPDARFEVVGLARRDRGREDSGDMGHVLRVDRSVRAPLPHRLQPLAAVL